MFYRVIANIIFDIDDEAVDFFRDCHNALPKGITLNPNADNEEKSAISLHICHHDAAGTQNCTLLESEHSP